MDLKFKIIQDLHERKGGGYIKNTLMSLGIGIIALFVVDIPNPLIRLVCLFILFFGMVGIFFNLILYTMESSLLDEIKDSHKVWFLFIDTKIRKPNYKKVSIDLTFKNSQGLFKDTIMQDTTAYARHFERLDKEDLKAKVFRAYLKDDTLIMLESEIISKLH